ncbi:uncharacterized protein VSU04_011170 [Chlamydotis macqueenii]
MRIEQMSQSVNCEWRKRLWIVTMIAMDPAAGDTSNPPQAGAKREAVKLLQWVSAHSQQLLEILALLQAIPSPEVLAQPCGDDRWELSKPDKGDLKGQPKAEKCPVPSSPGAAAEIWRDRRRFAGPDTWSRAHQESAGCSRLLQSIWQQGWGWAAPMSAKLYVLISWPDGSRVINIENIKEPRKPFHLYEVGEQVLARCPGFSGLYWGTVEGISEHKDILEKKLLEERQLLEKLKEEPAIHSMMPPQPKKSRKTFPKWTLGNTSRKYHGDRTYPAKPLQATLPHDAGSSSIIKERRTPGNAAGGPHLLAGAPHPTSAFTPPSTFVTMAVSGTSQGEEDRAGPATRDYVALPMKRKSDGILSQCQQHVCLSSCEERKLDALQETDDFERVQKNFVPGEMERAEKIEQLERMVLDLQQDVLSLKKKVQRLESLSFQEEPHWQPCEVVELFNGYTKEQLKETIRFDQKISTACKTLLYKLFTSDYIQSHSITGRRGNTFREAKPMMDERCIKIIRVLLKQKFGDHLSDTVITEKIQNVQKALRQKFKTECL